MRVGSQFVAATPQLYDNLIACRNPEAEAILLHEGQQDTIIARKPPGTTTPIPDRVYKSVTEPLRGGEAVQGAQPAGTGFQLPPLGHG
jgi:hypothetical protein